MAAKKYYAYRLASGKEGICDNWKDCEKIVSGRDARFRGFPSLSEAQNWLNAGAKYESRSGASFKLKVKKELESGIYFDAGTGRGKGVEISVTDEQGKDLLHKVLIKKKINRHGKHL